MAHGQRAEHQSIEPLIEPLEVDLSIVDGEAVVVVAGELDVFSIPRLRQTIHEAQDSQVDRIVIDLSALSFIDVMGLNALVRIASDTHDHGTAFAVRHPSDAVRRIGELVGIEDGSLPAESSDGQGPG